jgi:hypothetical protein
MAGLKPEVGELRGFRIAFACACLMLRCIPASAQANVQLWGDYSINSVLQRNDRVSWSVDLEPQALISAPSGDPAWYSTSVTPAGEYAVNSWLDATAEVGTTYTRQTDGLRSFELTPRGGVRFHTRLLQKVPTLIPRNPFQPELPPTRRGVLRDLLRVEERNLFYNGDEPTTATVRLRNRVEYLYPINRARITDNGVRTLMLDWEWFIPLGDATERFASRQRVRAGLAFRRSYNWRLETLYIWNKSRNTIDEPFSTSDNIVSITLKHFLDSGS